MYFQYLLWVGVCALMTAMVASGSAFLLLWLVLAMVLYAIQIDAPTRFPASEARVVFSANVVAQWTMCVAVAILSHGVGASLMAMGMTANMAVILANGGRMPILGDTWDNVCYREADEQTRLTLLCDHLRTTQRGRHSWTISPGDVLEVIGIWVFSAELVL